MGLSGFASRVWVGLTMLGVGCLWVWGGLGGSWDGLFFLTSCMNASYIFFTYTFLCVTSDAHEARHPSLCNALDKLLRLGCWRSDAHSRGSENENP